MTETTDMELAGLPFKVDFCRRYESDQIGVSFVDEGRPTTDAIEAAIDVSWHDELRDARKSGRLVYNGELGRLVRVTTQDDFLHFLLAQTCYRDFIGTNIHNLDLTRREEPDGLADPLGVSSIVITNDGLIALGRRSQRVAIHGGFLHTFGGMLEAPDRLEDGTYDVFGAARRELREEMPLDQEGIKEMVVVGLVRDSKMLQPELLFDVHMDYDSAAMLACFQAKRKHNPKDPEHTLIEFVKNEAGEIVDFITKAAPIAPIAQAALLLHGKLSWGEDWYDDALKRLYG